jgi:hypothetical protein
MPTTPTIPAGNLFMNATLYTGNASTNVITNGVAGQSFQPDLVWIKIRSSVLDHVLTDSIRGTNYQLASNTTAAESFSGFYITSLNSNGFSLYSSTGSPANTNGQTYVAWQWKAGGTAVSNTDGTITSSVSANQTSGFSVVTYTGTGSSSATVGHGLSVLGVAPSFIAVKSRNDGIDGWYNYHISLGATQAIFFNLTNAATTSVNYWNNISPTSSVFTIKGAGTTNRSGDGYVAYCWAPIAGYSQFGSYTGNGSTDGPFVYTGFRPRFVMFKRSDAVEQWAIRDTARDTYNATELELFPNLSNAEEDNNLGIDLVSNGFKIRNSSNRYNASGGTYVYACWAENPFKYSNAR